MKLFDNVGISVIHHPPHARLSLAWGYKHGFGYKWLPRPLMQAVVHLGNIICCRIWGHDDILWHIKDDLQDPDDPCCCDCLTPLTKCSCLDSPYD